MENLSHQIATKAVVSKDKLYSFYTYCLFILLFLIISECKKAYKVDFFRLYIRKFRLFLQKTFFGQNFFGQRFLPYLYHRCTKNILNKF